MRPRIKILVASVIVASFCVALSVFVERSIERRIAVVYSKEISLAEEVVFDSSDFLKYHQESVVLPNGTSGLITDSIECLGDTGGSDYMQAVFQLDDGSCFTVKISINPQIKNIDVNENTIDVPDVVTDDVTPVISIIKLADYQDVLSGYMQSRERYYTQLERTRIICAVIGCALSAVLVSAIWICLKRKYEQK